MRSFEFTQSVDFGHMIRLVSIDYDVGEHDECTLVSVWTLKDNEKFSSLSSLGEEITGYLSESGRQYFQLLVEQDWVDRKQEEAELLAERDAYIND